MRCRRCKKEGWINTHRKVFLIFNGTLFVLAWLFTKPVIQISVHVADVLESFGTLFLVTGVIGRFYSSLTIASHKNSQLVTTEMYSVVRHPLYFFSFFIVIGIGMLSGRLELFLYITAFYLACFYPMLLNEERHLVKMFGEAYDAYAKKVPRLIPNFSKWHGREKMEINMKLVTKTLLDAGCTLLLIPAIEIVEYIRHLIV
ncbi:MAG: isoprenylcysteine carboxylmethyltransferase family protein [Kiritimatiellaeota bacterium]|nr:isoprenylcysteine carboxylmethyltransferase family protein [Kiritimatiellota bacterium]